MIKTRDRHQTAIKDLLDKYPSEYRPALKTFTDQLINVMFRMMEEDDCYTVDMLEDFQREVNK